jgi:hemoglobin/transferrin/lactoferrin receptor protein
MMSFRALLAAVLGAAALPIFAAPVADPEAADTTDEEPARLERVVTVGTLVPRAIEDVAGTITSIDAERIEDEQIRDIRDLIRYEPGLSVDRDASRFGLGGFNIRGIDANRVAIEVDGVPIADGFDIGNFSNSGRDGVDPDMIRRVEILRGPASALYGSDAIGGVVTFTTKDPADLLGASSRALRTRAGWDGSDLSWHLNGTGAFDLGPVDALFSYTWRDGQELDNADAGGRPANPQRYTSEAFFSRMTHLSADGLQWRLTVDHRRAATETEVVSLIGGPGRFASTTDLSGDDSQSRTTVLLDGDLPDSMFGHSGIWRLYQQSAETDQFTHQELAASTRSPDPTARDRRFLYSQDRLGGEITLHKDLAAASTDHLLTYGLEFTITDTEELRDGTLTNLTTGATDNVIIGEVFPLRDFPNSKATELAAYIQDEVVWRDGPDGRGLRLIPALRFDSYELDPDPDAIYLADNPNTTPTGLSETSVTPRLGLVQDLAAGGSLFVQYTEGFRSPPFNDVNIGLENPIFGFRAIPNPDLQPETSRGVEFGYRTGRDWGDFDLALYYNRYRNLIESRVVVGVDPADGFLVFQSVNRAEAQIYGLELRTHLDLEFYSARLAGLSVDAALAVSDGRDTARSQPLNTVDPTELVLGLSYAPVDGFWDVSLIMTAVTRKGAVDTSGGAQFVPDGFAVLDLVGSFQLSERSRVQWGIYNLLDRTYWRWSDVRGLPAGDPTVDLAAQPGINFSISASVDL